MEDEEIYTANGILEEKCINFYYEHNGTDNEKSFQRQMRTPYTIKDQ